MGLCFNWEAPQTSTRFSLGSFPRSQLWEFGWEPNDLVLGDTLETVLKCWPYGVCSPAFLNFLPLKAGSCVTISRYGDMRVMMAYELFSMWQNLGRSLLPIFPLHILHSQIKSDKTNNFSQVLWMLIQAQETFTYLQRNTSAGWYSTCAQSSRQGELGWEARPQEYICTLPFSRTKVKGEEYKGSGSFSQLENSCW